MKIKDFDEKFTNSTPHTFYNVTITSENSERQTFRNLSDFEARYLYAQLKEMEE